MPFLLGDDGAPLREINCWLRLLPSHGARSAKTWRAYALDLLDWHDFLTRRESTVLTATRDDLAAYHAERRLGDGGRERLLAPASWNRKITAIEGFYAWAVDEGLLTAAPFSYRYTRVQLEAGGSTHVKTNLAKEKSGRGHAHVRWLEPEQLRTFLDVGMNGLLPDGFEDPAFRGRNAARNRAFALLLATTGLRVQEASHLLVTELPALPSKRTPYVRMPLPAPICKGEKERTTLVTPDTLRQVHSYIRIERSFADEGEYAPADALAYTDLTPTHIRLDRKTPLGKLSLTDRQRLVANGISPILFLTNNGAPVRVWQRVFDDATERCRSFDPSFPQVTPHTLRHTYAVHMLRSLIEYAARAVGRAASGDEEAALMAGYWRVYDPLLTLRDLMGHASVATTQIYLSAIDATRWYANFLAEQEEADDGE